MSSSGNAREQAIEQRGRHRRRAVGERAQARRAARAGTPRGCISMPIIVGTITVIVTWCCSIASITATGSNSGTITDVPPIAGTPRMPPIDAAWNIGVWCRYTSSGAIRHASATWYRFSISARWSSSTPLGMPVVPPVYMRIDRVVLFGLVGDDRRRGREQLLVVDVVRRVAARRSSRRARARPPRAPARSRCAKNASVKHTFVPESARMYASSFGASRRLSGLITPAPRNAAW